MPARDRFNQADDTTGDDADILNAVKPAREGGHQLKGGLSNI